MQRHVFSNAMNYFPSDCFPELILDKFAQKISGWKLYSEVHLGLNIKDGAFYEKS